MRSISRSNWLKTLAAGTAWGVFYQETKFPLRARLWVAQEKIYFIFCMNRRKEQKASLFSHSLQFVPKYFSDSHIATFTDTNLTFCNSNRILSCRRPVFMIHKYLVSYIVVISLLGFLLDSFCGWDLLQNSPFRCCQPVCWSRRAGRPPELGEPPSLSLTWKQHCDPGRQKWISFVMKTLCQDTRRLRVCFHVLQLIQYEIVIRDYYVKWKLRYGQLDSTAKLKLDSSNSWWENPQQPILRERLAVIKVIPVLFMAFFCVCFHVSQGSKGKGKVGER